MSAGPTQLAGVGDRGSSSHHPPPPPPPKILLAKPPLPPPSSSSGADDDGGARARQGPQPGSLSLVSDAWEVHTDKILPYLTENNDFMVIGVIGPPGVGKSAIMNELYGYDANSPGLAIVIMGVSGCGKSTVAALLAEALGCSFIEADDYHSEANKAKMSKGIPLTDTDHIPWLESLRDAIRERLDRGEDVAVSCSALQLIYREILREGDRRYKAGSYGSCRVKFVCLEASAEVIGERIRRRSMEGEHFMPASLLQSQLDLLQIDDAEGVTKVDATVCPEAIVHGTIAQFREELASTVDLLKHNIPDPSLLTSSSSPDKENKNDYQSGSEEYMADLCFVHAGLREQDFSPSKLMLLRKILEKHFESSSFSIGSSGATPQVSDSSVSSSLKVEDLNSSRQDVFLLPRAPDNSTKFEYGTYSSMLSVLRDQILSRPPRSFSKNLSERDWLRSTAKIWDMVKKSPVITECCKALQSSGLFRK